MKRLISAIAAAWLTLGGTAISQSSAWRYETDQNPLTDKMTFGAYTSARGNIWLVVACSIDEIRVAASTSLIDVELSSFRNVTWRVDKEPPVTQTWENLRGSGAAVLGRDALELIRAIQSAKTRVVVKSGRETREFGVAGSTSAISKALDKCENPLLD